MSNNSSGCGCLLLIIIPILILGAIDPIANILSNINEKKDAKRILIKQTKDVDRFITSEKSLKTVIETISEYEESNNTRRKIKVRAKNQYKYNENNLIIEVLTEDFILSSKKREILLYNSFNKITNHEIRYREIGTHNNTLYEKKEYLYDKYGKIIKLNVLDGLYQINASVEYKYNNNILFKEIVTGGFNIGLTGTKLYYFDKKGYKKEMKILLPNGEIDYIEKYFYNTFNQLEMTIIPGDFNKKIIYKYDSNQNLIFTEEYLDSDILESEEFTYNKKNDLIKSKKMSVSSMSEFESEIVRSYIIKDYEIKYF